MNRRYLRYLAMLVAAAALYILYSWLASRAQATMIHTQLADRRLVVDSLCDGLEILVAGNPEEELDYTEVAVRIMERTDGHSNAYAALFSEDLTPLTMRHPAFNWSPFDPREYPEIVYYMGLNNRGEVTARYNKAGNGVWAHDMYLYFRWVDVGMQRVLAVVGSSRYTINNALLEWEPYVIVLAAVLGCVVFYIFPVERKSKER